MKPVKLGVIGSGYWGPNLIRNFVELPSAHLVAVADLNEERLAQVQSRYPTVEVTTSYCDLFTMGLEAVVVATPPVTHFRIARDCLRHGLHVLVEKPLTLNGREAKELTQMAEERGLTLMVGHTFVYNPAVRQLRTMIKSGELGDIHYIDSVRVNLGLYQPDLDVVWDLAPHDISILLYMLDSEPVLVSAHGGDYIIKGVHDIAYLNLEFPDHTLAHVRVSWLDPRKVRQTTVVGSQKMVVYDDVDSVERLKIYDKGVQSLAQADSFADFQLSYRNGDVLVPSIPFAEPLQVQCKQFLDSIVNGTTPESSGRAGWKVVRVLEAAQRSLYYGGLPQEIDWAADEDEPTEFPGRRWSRWRSAGPVADCPVPVDEPAQEEADLEKITA
jgi:predicted dehydrogenase